MEDNKVIVAAASKFLSFDNVRNTIQQKATGIGKNINELIEVAYPYIISIKNGTETYSYEETYAFVSAYIDDPDVCKDVFACITMFCFENAIYKAISQWNKTDDILSIFNWCAYTVYTAAFNYKPDCGTTFVQYVFTALKNNIRAENVSAINGRTTIGGGRSTHHARENAWISNNPDMSDEELAINIYASTLEGLDEETYKKVLAKKIKRVSKVRQSIQTSIVSINAPVGEDGDEFGAFIADATDVSEEYQQKEQENILLTKFIPIIADIYGDDCAYITLLRTGLLWGFEKISFYKMENLYSQYLVTVKKLNQLSEEIPSYAEHCKALKHAYATCGEPGYIQYIKGIPEEYLFQNLIVEAHKEAKIIADGDRKSSECFKPAGSLNYMFSKVFPIKGSTFSDRDKKNAARFRKELRDIGMDEIANRLFAMFSSAE